MSMESIAKEWLAARKVIADAAVEAQIPIESNRFAEAVIARLANHKPPILLEMEGDSLQQWLEGEFRDACENDTKRLTESLWMLKVGMDRGDSPEKMMGAAIASFVKGLICGEQPITVPTENN